MSRFTLYSCKIVTSLLVFVSVAYSQKITSPRLQNKSLQVKWGHSSEGYRLNTLLLKDGLTWRSLSGLLGQYTLLYTRRTAPYIPAGYIRQKWPGCSVSRTRVSLHYTYLEGEYLSGFI